MESKAKVDLSGRHLVGAGVEFGALHTPLLVDTDRATVKYVDRLTLEQALEAFPEFSTTLIGFRDSLVDPDFIIDINVSDLAELTPHQFDFFIANDVVEHIPNPLRFLENVHDVMKPGALFFLTVPDKDYTFDASRELTSNDHLWTDYTEGATEVADYHIEDFCRHAEGKVPGRLRRRKAYAQHRERSIHVHVWNQASFDDFLDWLIDKLAVRWETIDRARSEDAEGNMIYILEKTVG